MHARLYNSKMKYARVCNEASQQLDIVPGTLGTRARWHRLLEVGSHGAVISDLERRDEDREKAEALDGDGGVRSFVPTFVTSARSFTRVRSLARVFTKTSTRAAT